MSVLSENRRAHRTGPGKSARSRLPSAVVVGVLVAQLCTAPASSAAATDRVGLPPAQLSSAAVPPSGADLCAKVADEAGFSGAPLVTAVAVGLAESGCTPAARGLNGPTSGCPSGSVDRGLWQINSCYNPDVSDACAYEAACNARAAYRISAGGTSWKPWSSYNNGRHLGFLDEARAAVARLQTPQAEVFAFGDAPDLGSTAGMPLLSPLVGMAGSPSGRGYRLVAADGGIFAYGDAPFLGSTGGIVLNRPVVGMAATSSGNGYWLVAADGGIFAYGDAAFLGSSGAAPQAAPVVGVAASAGGNGYRTVAADGAVLCFGDAACLGRPDPAILRGGRVVGIAASPGDGYWVVAAR